MPGWIPQGVAEEPGGPLKATLTGLFAGAARGSRTLDRRITSRFPCACHGAFPLVRTWTVTDRGSSRAVYGEPGTLGEHSRAGSRASANSAHQGTVSAPPPRRLPWCRSPQLARHRLPGGRTRPDPAVQPRGGRARIGYRWDGGVASAPHEAGRSAPTEAVCGCSRGCSARRHPSHQPAGSRSASRSWTPSSRSRSAGPCCDC